MPYFMSFLGLVCYGTDVIVSVYYCLLWNATTLVELSTHEVYYLLNCIGYLSSVSSNSCLIRALVPYYSHLLLLLNHVVIVVKLCSVEGLMEDRCISNKQVR